MCENGYKNVITKNINILYKYILVQLSIDHLKQKYAIQYSNLINSMAF